MNSTSNSLTNPLQQDRDLLKGKTVLLIEDDEVDQVLIGRMVSDQGGHLILESDKDRAIECLKTKLPHLIVMDTNIQGVNALEYTKNLRNNLKINTPIIGLTSVNYQGRGVHHGLDIVLRKPIDYSQFKRAVQTLVK